MARRQVITPVYNFPERIIAFGLEGSGKSSLIHQILRHHEEAHGWILDLDTSFAHERLLQTEYAENADRTHIFTVPAEWEMMQEAFDAILKGADFKRGDWLVVDPATVTWQMVQSWYSDRVHGVDISDHLMELRAKNKDMKGYSKEVAEDMTWPLINKVYQQQFYNRLYQWRSHFILTAEAEAMRKDAEAAEKEAYGYIGFKPRGQKALPFVSATNIYLSHPKPDQWTMTSVKDRGRQLVEKQPFDDFGLDYLVEIAGWDMEVVK